MSDSTLSLSNRLAQRPAGLYGRDGFAQQGLEDLTSMFHGMVKVHDLQAVFETVFAHVFQTVGAIDEHHDFAGAPMPGGWPPGADRGQSGQWIGSWNIGGRFVVPHWMALFIGVALGEDAAQINLAGLGRAVGLLALASGQLLPAHGHAGAIALTYMMGASLGPVAPPVAARLGRPGPPVAPRAGFVGAHLDAPVSARCRCASHSRVHRLLPDRLTGPRRACSHLQAQRGIGRIVPLAFAGMVIIIARQGEGAKETLHLQGFPAFGCSPGLGW